MALFTHVGCSKEKSCQDRQNEAQALLQSYQACKQDDECMIASIPAQCLTPFLCSSSVRRDADLVALSSAARELSFAYRDHCTDCVVADCVDPSSLRAVCQNGLCSSESNPRPEAKSCEDRREEAQALLKSYQACEQDDDCMITSVKGQCLEAFVCSSSVRRDADLAALNSAAQEMSDAYQQQCDHCVIAVAECMATSEFRAVCTNGFCAHEPRSN